MIRRIVLENFMSHRRTVIEPAAGLTVLIGPNNCGKSAVVSALQTLCYNQSGDYMLRHGERECSVTVETDDGHTLCWRRNKSSSYSIDGEEIHRLGRASTPDRLHELLRLPKVCTEDGKDEFEIHFGAQKSPIFLLNETDGKRAMFFAASSDAALLLRMQTLHRDRVRTGRRDVEEIEAKLAGFEAELAALSPIDVLRETLSTCEQEHAALARLEQELDRLQNCCHLIAAQQAEQQRAAGEIKALGQLREPPTWHTTEPIDQAIRALDAATDETVTTAATLTALGPLRPPPELPDVKPLAALSEAIQTAATIAAAQRHVVESLRPLAPPPDLPDLQTLADICRDLARSAAEAVRQECFAEKLRSLTDPPLETDLGPLAQLVEQLRGAQAEEVKRIAAAELAQRELEAAEAEISAWAEGNPICQTCGAPVDAQRLIAGAHEHA